MNKRVHQIAKEHGLAAKDVLERLKAGGLEVKAVSSSVDEDAARRVLGDGGGAGAADSGAARKAPRGGDGNGARSGEGQGQARGRSDAPRGRSDAPARGGAEAPAARDREGPRGDGDGQTR